MYTLIVLPWVLTVAALLYIIVRNRRFDDGIQEVHDDGYLMEEDNQVTIKAAVYDDKAYWVYNNVFYESEVMREPDWETARPIDTMELSPKELNQLLVILDELGQETERD